MNNVVPLRPEHAEFAGPKNTALHDLHAELGARFTDFGGWDMPLRYGRELEEHRAVRESAGVFDLSHMGEVRITGRWAASFLDDALISRLSAVPAGKAKYSMMCDEDGGIIDDLIVYRLGDEEFLVVPNAGNAATVLAEFRARAERYGGRGTPDRHDLEIFDETGMTTLIAVQGPRAEDIVSAIVVPSTGLGTAEDLGEVPSVAGLGYYSAMLGVIRTGAAGDGVDAAEAGPYIGAPEPGDVFVMLARTGYTGEDGFELFLPNDDARATWDAVFAAAKRLGVEALPCGLASRDTLRLEAGMPLYGNELSRDVTPVDAGLGVLAATKSKDAFVGRDAIVAAKEAGPKKVLVGLAGQGRRAARAGYPVLDADGNEIGRVTSGALSPTLGHPIALAYVDTGAGIAAGLLDGTDPTRPAPVVGAKAAVDVRGKALPYDVVKPPFYKRN